MNSIIYLDIHAVVLFLLSFTNTLGYAQAHVEPNGNQASNCYSDIMSSLKLNKYARLDSPSFANGSIDVYTGFYIESMDGLQAAEMSLGLDIYFRMSWNDVRLRHGHQLCMINSIEALHGLWVPDLYFANAKNANFHDVTVPNFILHIAPNGTVSYSCRVTLTTACDMDLVDYPLDYQTCTIKLLSYGYTRDKLKVQWFSVDPLESNPSIHLPEMYILNITAGYCDGRHIFAKTEYGYKQGVFSCLEARIRLKRAIGYHLVQTYIPTGLIVMISWVSFWIDVNAVPARVSLSFTTLLTLATQGAGLRIALPPVAYAKAVDYWFGMCMIFVFAALLEFAAVNNLMRRSKKLAVLAANATGSAAAVSLEDKVGNHANEYNADVENALVFAPSLPLTSRAAHRMRCESDAYARRALMVDKICRFAFPAAYTIFNLVYWIYYVANPKYRYMRDYTVL